MIVFVLFSDVAGHVAKLVPVTFDQAGALYLVNITSALQRGGEFSIDTIYTPAVFEGDRSYARFGWQTNWFDVNLDGVDDLVFSAPFRTDDITEKLRGGIMVVTVYSQISNSVLTENCNMLVHFSFISELFNNVCIPSRAVPINSGLKTGAGYI